VNSKRNVPPKFKAPEIWTGPEPSKPSPQPDGSGLFSTSFRDRSSLAFARYREPIVAMEQLDDAGFCAWNSCIFNAVNVLSRLVDVASTNRLRVLTRLFAILST
jgi:hypothetical protein